MTENVNEKTADDQLAEDVLNDFLHRQEERRATERGWQLNMNFLCGNQYCDLNAAGEISEEQKQYFWQARRVFNHIAPTLEIRCSKLGRIRPSLTVRAASDEEQDIHSASLASAILSSVGESADLDGIISDATVWAETCGTAFYKVMWDSFSGGTVGAAPDGKKLRQGDVKIAAVSPFEIYPYSMTEEKICMQPSLIHAKAMPVQDIYSAYGVKLTGRDIEEFTLADYPSEARAKRGGQVKALRCGYELVIERYEKPTAEFPDGRLTVVAGGKLLYDGILPYINGENGARDYPFIKQTSVQLAGRFFGASIVDRLIPLQRAYNAVKNRKHEFLNRISMGTVAVEDGSVDVDELCEDGLTPGKVIVYRQGGKPPEMLTLGTIPAGFADEEKNLLEEFAKVSGTGELTQNADSFAGVTSATGLQLIIEQDEEKLENAYRQIKRAVKRIGKHILRLYRQFASDVRLLKFGGENNVMNLYYFKGSDISSDDVVLETDGEANLTPAQRRTVIYEMLDRGLFSDENGNLAAGAKNKILSLLGYKGLAGERDLSALNRARAGEENLLMKTGKAEVKEYDGHAVHITEHTAFLLTEKHSGEIEKRICAHIDMHRQKLEKEKKDSEISD